MDDTGDISQRIGQLLVLFKDKLGLRGTDLTRVVKRARPELTARVYRQALLLANAQPMAAHPKLRLTLNDVALNMAADEVQAYLDQIDAADRRKGFWLGVLGAIVFNLLLVFGLLVMFLVWQEFI